MNRQHDEYRIYGSDGPICLNTFCSPATTLRLASQRRPAPSSTPTAEQYTLYHFMDRWTCSSCWRVAKALGQMEEWLADHGITVVLVGQNHYFQQAKNLTKELHLPFRLVNDEYGSLKRLYGFGECSCTSRQQNLVLVDRKGCVRYKWQIPSYGKVRQLGSLQATVEPQRSK